ncbi:exocyst complex component Sec3-domain-containing protein [Catenaria anguillulae PL171]|uniref:Exocyst complex component Sec3-domain-containing protein n=1 Tax=Catenaria anguillulae PL171 TaxID=765915 RepID=A0A1Y2HXT8_9FUNG|nr:exocyst complex component Sec3-domain-containing protein [Catenaria anguillulae PL171]
MSLAVKQHLNGLFAPAGESLLAVMLLVPNVHPADTSPDHDHDQPPRYLCLTAKRNGKNKLAKVKYANGAYNVSKTWALADLQVVEVLDRTSFVTVFSKPHQWTTNEPHAKDEFVTTLLKLAKKKPPRLVNVDAGLMKASNYDLFDDLNNLPGGEAGDDATLPDGSPAKRSAMSMATKLTSDLTRLESENIHALIESTQRTQLILGQIDKAIQKLDLMSSWISSYASTLAEIAPQVHYIQDQNRRSQTQQRNQSRLKSTLTDFLSSLAVPPQLEHILRHEPLDQTTVAAVEHAAQSLLAAQHTQLDPDLKHMAVVREQSDRLRDLSATFAARLGAHILGVLAQECEVMRGDRGRPARCRAQLKVGDPADRELAVAPFRGLVLWLKQAEVRAYQEVVAGYVQHVGPVVRSDVKEVVEAVRLLVGGGGKEKEGKAKDKDTAGAAGSVSAEGDVVGVAAEYLFTAPTSMAAQVAGSVSAGLSKAGSKAGLSVLGGRREKEKKEAAAAAAAAMAGTRGGSLGRRVGGSETSSTDLVNAGYEGAPQAGIGSRSDFGVAFTTAVSNIVAAVLREQNFIVGFFHLYPSPPSFEARSPKPNPRRWRDALPQYPVAPQAVELVKDVVGAVFDGLARELSGLADAGLAKDGGSALVMLNCVEKQIAHVKATVRGGGAEGGADVVQMFLFSVLAGMQTKLRAAWAKVLDQQLKAIQESKLAKRKTGILSFVRTCPRFVEHMIDAVDSPLDPVRSLLETALETVLKLVVHSIESIPVVDDEVLILENSLYLSCELRSGPASTIPVLADHMDRLYTLSTKHADDYVAHLLHKALGKFMDFIVGLETLLVSQTPEEVAFHQAYAKAIAKKIVASLPAKEMAKACEYVHKKVYKSLTDASVMEQVWAIARRELERVHERAVRVLGDVYRGEVDVEFTFADVRNACASLD